VEGKVGLGMWCDGTSGHIRVRHSAELEPSRLTVESWVCLDELPARGTKRWLVNKNGHGWTDGYYGLLICGDKVVGDLNIGGEKENRFEAWSDAGALAPGRWHHLAMTYDGAALRVYRDGESVAQTDVGKPREPGRGALVIGRWANGYHHLRGVLDEVRIYRRALSAREIRARCDRPDVLEPAAAAAVVGHWGFDLEAEPADPACEWEWAERPAKSGARAHTNAPAARFTGHATGLLRDPLDQHLPVDRRQAVGFLKEQIPRLGPTGEAWRFFNDLLGLELADPRGRAELNRWLLTTFPRHSRALDALGGLLEAHRDAGDPDPASRVESVIDQLGFPLQTLYRYHRKYAHPPRHFVRRWQVIGPFRARGEGWGFDTRYPPESDGVDLAAAYNGAGGQIHWQPHVSDTGYVNLNVVFQPNDNVVAYAGGWIHAERNTTVVLAVGGDDWCKVWVNRRAVLSGRNRTYASAGEFIASVRLTAGWNEVLVKVTEGTGEWGFYFELLDRLARRPPPGVRITSEPPRQ
jgi:hypothetical protein